ncbi:MAG: hypothetical protein NZ954_01195 [Thermofilaceae archaeon]|nr:hypothetical protein [Thermofilaceae archaeon]MCX8180515.1 hypothetical protein [Thermofilaceae archaeon]MDW8003289.1 hypothetical protein [Thermofilaceae archaeon]
MEVSSAVAWVVILAAIMAAILMAVYVPVRLFELSGEGKLNVIAAGIFSALGIIAGASIAFFTVVVGIPILLGAWGTGERVEVPLKQKELEEKLVVYRARQRAMLEELDEVRKILEEIRDLLKEGMGA